MKQKVLTARNIALVFLTIVLALCVGLIAAFGTTGKNSASAAEEKPLEVYILGASDVVDTANGFDIVAATDTTPLTYKYVDHSAGWAAAVLRAMLAGQQNVSAPVKVVLASNWEATVAQDGSNTSFGTATNGFYNGIIRVPVNTNFVIDLNGNAINRKLVEIDKSQQWGKVLLVDGTLEIADSSTGGTGKIMGGYATNSGGGIQIQSTGNVTLSGGSIEQNISTNRGGAIYTSGTFNMTGGKITHNRAINLSNLSLGGAIYMSGGTLNISGGEITYNELVARNQASGSVLGTIGGTFTISGGLIAHNTAESTLGYIAGGAIYAQGVTGKICGNARIWYNECFVNNSSNIQSVVVECQVGSVVTLTDEAEIAYNKGYRKNDDGSLTIPDNSFGSVCLTGGKFYMEGGYIRNNIAGQGAGIEVLKDAGQDACVITGGEISGNLAVNVWGAIHYAQEARIKISGSPVIKDNYSLKGTQFEKVQNYTYNNGSEQYNGEYKNITVYKSNLRINDNGSAAGKHAFDINVGTMEEGAEVYININTLKEGFSVNYGANNSTEVGTGDVKTSVSVDPTKYFKSDMGYAIVLNSDGEMVEVPHEVMFNAGYGDTPASVDGYAAVFAYEKGSALAWTLSYNGSEQTAELKKGDQTVASATDAGVYKIVATIEEKVEVVFAVVITPKVLTADNTQIAITGAYVYDGTAKTPTYTLSEGSNSLAADADYTATLNNNTNAGDKAEIAVEYKGNYSGKVIYYWTIANATQAYAVVWEYDDGTGWKTFPSGGAVFVYNAVDYSANVRAVLTVSGASVEEYVYAKDLAQHQNTTNMYLTFAGTFEDDPVTDMVNASTYAIAICGTSNYVLDDGLKTATAKVNPRPLDLSPADFVDYNGTGEENRLWSVLTDGQNTEQLRDRATYFDPDAAFNAEYGAKVVTGNLYNSYVRYTGEEHTVTLNLGYVIRSSTLGAYMSSITDIQYTNNTATGVDEKVNSVTTEAKLILNGNWATDAGAAFITIQKTWYIVTINNTLRSADGDENTTVSNRTFGVAGTQLLFRPEHGDVAIYTVSDGTTAVARFAVKFSGGMMGGTTSYFEVKEEGGSYIADETKPITSANYYADLLKDLNAGSYTLNVYVPKCIASSSHEHWWGGSEEEVGGVVYYPISLTYMFNVARFEVTASNMGEGQPISMEMLADRVYYNAKADNVPALEIYYNDKLLVKDVDYSCSSANVNVGKASFVLTGIGNFAGEVEFEDSYDIVQAVNTWSEVPSVMYWTFGDYRKNVNFINAVPAYLDDAKDLTFKITTDEDGLNVPYAALAKFALTDGEVDDNVAAALSLLEVQDYYLFAEVAGNSNYLPIAQRGVPFKVIRGVNAWTTTPSVNAWTEGGYDASATPIEAVAKFGNVIMTVTDKNGNKLFDSANGVDLLAGAGAGEYTLVAYVDGETNFNGLDLYTVNFEIFKKPGLPWWGTLLIVIGALGIAAVVLWILHEKGVLQMLTGKIVIAMRTKMTVDATIAAVRANKRAEESRKSVAKAELMDRLEDARKALEAEKAKPAEERAALLEERAAAEVAKAEKAQKRAEKLQQQAKQLKGNGETPSGEDTTDEE